MNFYYILSKKKNKTIKMYTIILISIIKATFEYIIGPFFINKDKDKDKENGIDNEYMHKITNYPEIKMRKYHNLRNMLEEKKIFNSYNDNQEELSDYEKHIKLIIIIVIIIASLIFIVSSIFLIKFLCKRCKKKKEEKNEQEEKNGENEEKSKDISNYTKKSKKNKNSRKPKSIELSYINLQRMRNSTPFKRNKTYSFNNPTLSSIKLRNSNKIDLKHINDDKNISNTNKTNNTSTNDKNKNEEPSKIKSDCYSNCTFTTNSDYDAKDNDFEEVLKNL